ncbi:peptidylprolyl isomerase A [Geothermobacter hydrogeniphilus]|uniref:Peptidyl-prolyl cis-trans isomerase n=1 Tax=Geothermobacter hydrogeniphilus TaxID=1969733 RepID=A0A2K2HAX8_9BACT|nr:peptidylprolyl isomerase [Geothermobacter hydrogeniphilus]PNU20383.1 peptidylprolyl isomerase A [Geothermobacter hydrogeniphilus]
MKKLVLLLIVLTLASPALAGTRVLMTTNLGTITLDLDEARAPESVKNFLTYADAGFYDGTIFHRVIKGFMIQGGGFDTALKRKATRPPIRNEAGNGLKNVRGAIAMARTNVIDSATSQFFINLVDNDFLNHRGNDARGFGYAVFGKVVAGMDIVDRIARVPTEHRGGPFANLPRQQVVIKSIRRAE